MGTIFVISGIVVIFAAVIGYVITNPRVIQQLRDTITTARRSANDAQQLADDLRGSVGRVSSDASADDQFEDLRLNETAEIYPDREKVLERTERTVTCRGTLQALNRQGRNFTDRGEPWLTYILDHDIMLFKRPDGWCWLDKSRSQVLDGESAREFDAAGEDFGGKNLQSARSKTFTWRSFKLTIIDVGYLRFERIEGSCHLAHGEMVKYMLAEDSDGNLFYLENLKVGTDRVWKAGIALGMSIKPFVGTILRAA